MGYKSWLPAALAALAIVSLFRLLIDWMVQTPYALHLLTFYSAGQVLSMGAFWTMDHLSQRKGYKHLAPFFSRPDTAAFAKESDRVGSTVAFFSSWLYLAFVAIIVFTGRYRQKWWQRTYERMHLALWRFATVLAIVAPIGLAIQILTYPGH